MKIPESLRNAFNPHQRQLGRVLKLVAGQADWSAIAPSLAIEGRKKGIKPAEIIDAVYAAQNWKLLPPLIAAAAPFQVGDIALRLAFRDDENVFRTGAHLKNLDAIYDAMATAPKNASEALKALVVNTATVSAVAASEELFDWARRKPEFQPVEGLAVVMLASDRATQVPQTLLSKLVASGTNLEGAIDFVKQGRWAENGSEEQQYTLQKLEKWRDETSAVAAAKKSAAPKFNP